MQKLFTLSGAGALFVLSSVFGGCTLAQAAAPSKSGYMFDTVRSKLGALHFSKGADSYLYSTERNQYKTVLWTQAPRVGVSTASVIDNQMIDTYPGNIGSSIFDMGGIATDATGGVYVTHGLLNTIVRINIVSHTHPHASATSFIPSFGFPFVVGGAAGISGYTGDGGNALSALFNNPTGIAIGDQGNIYIADTGNHVIRKISSGNIVTTIAGTGAAGFSGEGVPATIALLNQPHSIAINSLGHIYFTDSAANVIRRIANGIITTVAGTGASGNSGDNGLATSATLFRPTSIVINSKDVVFFADSGNGTVRKIESSRLWHVTDIANVQGLAIDSGDNIYMTDGGSVISRMSSDYMDTTTQASLTSVISGAATPSNKACAITNAHTLALFASVVFLSIFFRPINNL